MIKQRRPSRKLEFPTVVNVDAVKSSLVSVDGFPRHKDPVVAISPVHLVSFVEAELLGTMQPAPPALELS